MPWFKVDDGFHGHPKVLDLSMADIGVWTLAGTWCASYLTDGRITAQAVARLGGTPENTAALVRAGLWDEVDGAFQFRDWEDYQPMKADIEAEREAARERMKAVRARKKRSPEQPANVQPKFGGSSAYPDPSHPSPSQPNLFASAWEEFWDTYPKKKGKGDAEKAWAKATENATPETIMAGLVNHLPEWSTKEIRFIPNPSTWLNQGRWADEVLAPESVKKSSTSPWDREGVHQ